MPQRLYKLLHAIFFYLTLSAPTVSSWWWWLSAMILVCFRVTFSGHLGSVYYIIVCCKTVSLRAHNSVRRNKMWIIIIEDSLSLCLQHNVYSHHSTISRVHLALSYGLVSLPLLYWLRASCTTYPDLKHLIFPNGHPLSIDQTHCCLTLLIQQEPVFQHDMALNYKCWQLYATIWIIMSITDL